LAYIHALKRKLAQVRHILPDADSNVGGREGSAVKEENFGTRLTRLMKEKRMTVAAAAGIAGVATSTLQRWREGSPPTNFEAVMKLAQALGVSFTWLLTGRQDSTASEEVAQDVVHAVAASAIRAAESGALLEPGMVLFDGLLEVRVRRVQRK
jgi:transcriptional regulator with XRE-family HTH domain